MAWYDHLEYGDPVVCVDNAGWPIQLGLRMPLVEGKVYLFEAYEIVGLNTLLHKGCRTTIILRSIRNPCSRTDGFAATRFRPATSTDLPTSIREALKTPAPKEKVCWMTSAFSQASHSPSACFLAG